MTPPRRYRWLFPVEVLIAVLCGTVTGSIIAQALGWF